MVAEAQLAELELAREEGALVEIGAVGRKWIRCWRAPACCLSRECGAAACERADPYMIRDRCIEKFGTGSINSQALTLPANMRPGQAEAMGPPAGVTAAAT